MSGGSSSSLSGWGGAPLFEPPVTVVSEEGDPVDCVLTRWSEWGACTKVRDMMMGSITSCSRQLQNRGHLFHSDFLPPSEILVLWFPNASVSNVHS